MKQMGKHPLCQFKELPPSQKDKFNRIMNEYIQSLGEDWEPKLFSKFNEIVNEDILNEDFDPASVVIPQGGQEQKNELLLTEEQKEFLESQRIENGWETIRP